MITKDRIPILMVVSAPSGAGKTTLCDKLEHDFPNITYSVSCTTRAARVGEIDGKSYHFLSEEEFENKKSNGGFIEYANVHGHYYGTPRFDVVRALSEGKDVLMDLDVQGAASVREYVRSAPKGDPLRRAYTDVFIAPPSMEDLQLRLFSRGKDEEEVIKRRLAQAESEMKRWREYDYLILNDKLDEAYDALRSVYIAAKHRVKEEAP